MKGITGYLLHLRNVLAVLLLIFPGTRPGSTGAAEPEGGAGGPEAGFYVGLFGGSPTDWPGVAGQVRLRVTRQGSFNGLLWFATDRVSFRGQFDESGRAEMVLSRQGKSPVQLHLGLDPEEPGQRVTGWVEVDGVPGELTAFRNTFHPRHNPVPLAGRYALVFAHDATDDAQPRGHGYASMVVDRRGVVRLAGFLADGTPFSTVTYLSSRGEIPVFRHETRRRGLVLGWLQLSDGCWMNPVSGLLHWKAVPGPGNGLENAVQVGLLTRSSVVVEPARSLRLPQAQAMFDFVETGVSFTNLVELDPGGRAYNLSPNRLSLRMSHRTGWVGGVATVPGSRQRLVFRGMILQNRRAAFGYVHRQEIGFELGQPALSIPLHLPDPTAGGDVDPCGDGLTLNHVLIVGQSLGIGAQGFDILSDVQAYGNMMFAGQRLDLGQGGVVQDDLSALVPLVERGQETMASGFANWISARTGLGLHDFLMSNAARGASDYALLKREPSGDPAIWPTGTYPYLRGLHQVEAGLGLIGPEHYRFRGVLAVHGEGDSINPRYDENIRAWQRDYEEDIQTLTSQTNVIPMFHTQISAWGNLGNANRTLSPFMVLNEFRRSPERTVLVGPKYMLPYAADGLHLTSEGYHWLGEYYAKAYFQKVFLGRPWSPLHPRTESIQRSNNVIEITFDGGVGPLALDTNLVVNPGGNVIRDPAGGPSGRSALITIGPYGFEYWDSHGEGSPWACSTWIEQVLLVGERRVQIVLNQAPRGQVRRIRYAYTALNKTAGGRGGPELGPRGCLRDSDPSESLRNQSLYNWCVHFDEPCP